MREIGKKCQKHGLSQKEIEYFFQQTEVYVAPDPKHSDEEERFLAIGRSKKAQTDVCGVYPAGCEWREANQAHQRPLHA